MSKTGTENSQLSIWRNACRKVRAGTKFSRAHRTFACVDTCNVRYRHCGVNADVCCVAPLGLQCTCTACAWYLRLCNKLICGCAACCASCTMQEVQTAKEWQGMFAMWRHVCRHCICLHAELLCCWARLHAGHWGFLKEEDDPSKQPVSKRMLDDARMAS